LASAASGALNNYVDRDADKRMSRTQDRALPAGRLQPQQALWWGLSLSVISFFFLSLTVNLLTAGLAVSTIAFYVLIYTMWLKRTSPLCTAIGGVAGALPPVIGWAAVTGTIEWPALVLFGVMFLWQPPHFWALALLRADEYRRAEMPMLPVVRGERVTKRQMLLYTIALIPASAALYFLNMVGLFYLIVALVLGGLYLALTIDFARKPVTAQSAKQLFKFSILYLFLLFVMMFVDCHCSGF
jgi:protoheme IX farnesyltransferase